MYDVMCPKSNGNLPRGLRNNNPFNIKRSNQPWQGKINIPRRDFPHETTFEQFTNIRLGLRAGMKLLYNYIYLYGLSTVYDVLNRFAPRCENALDTYVAFVESYIQHNKDTMDFVCGSSLVGKKDIFFIMCEAIIKYENGVGSNLLRNFKLDAKSLSDLFTFYFPTYKFKSLQL